MRFSQKLNNLELWSLLTTYKNVLNGHFAEPIIGPIKFKMAGIRYLEITIMSTKKSTHFDEIWHTNAGLELDQSINQSIKNF